MIANVVAKSAFKVSSMRKLKTQSGFVPCIYAKCEDCDIPCTFGYSFLVMPASDAGKLFHMDIPSEPGHLLTIEATGASIQNPERARQPFAN